MTKRSSCSTPKLTSIVIELTGVGMSILSDSKDGAKLLLSTRSSGERKNGRTLSISCNGT